MRRRPKEVEKLRRYWGTVPAWWPVSNETDCAWPLYMHYRSIIASGQMQVAKVIVHFLQEVAVLWRSHCKRTNFSPLPPELFEDDFFRHYLKQLSAYAYPLIFTIGPAYMLLTHLHALNAKSPYTTEQIVDDINSWASDKQDGVPKRICMRTYGRTLDSVFARWSSYPISECLPFKEYVNDPLRWGTSGGAPKVKMFGKEQRSKWAWSVANKIHPTDGPQDAVDLAALMSKHGDVAKVALKEETQKTREIITTPLHSYVRQTYLLYRRGKVPIPSPISSPKWLPTFEGRAYNWYGCVDGERFDHSVPKEAIIELIQRLGELDAETKAVADAEIEHLNNLTIEWGEHTWKWMGGIMSGWRITSLAGSLVSLSAANYILENSGAAGAVEIGVMGDDIVLASNTVRLSADTMVALYREFGLKANLAKTVSGSQGEFLRKVRSKGGSWAFSALDLKTLTHAAPWVTHYQFAMEEECATSWHTLLSRLLPHATDPQFLSAWINKHAIHDLTSRFGRRPEWQSWLDTPICAGGGGYVERASLCSWTTLVKDKEDVRLTPYETLGSMLGILPTRRTMTTIRADTTHLDTLHNLLPKINILADSEYQPTFKRSACITKVIWRLINSQITPSELNKSLVIPIPHRLRMLRGPQLARLIVTSTKQMASVTSILHTHESLPQAGSIMATVTRQLYARRTGIPRTMIRPLATLHTILQFGDHPVAYGTW